VIQFSETAITLLDWSLNFDASVRGGRPSRGSLSLGCISLNIGAPLPFYFPLYRFPQSPLILSSTKPDGILTFLHVFSGWSIWYNWHPSWNTHLWRIPYPILTFDSFATAQAETGVERKPRVSHKSKQPIILFGDEHDDVLHHNCSQQYSLILVCGVSSLSSMLRNGRSTGLKCSPFLSMLKELYHKYLASVVRCIDSRRRVFNPQYYWVTVSLYVAWFIFPLLDCVTDKSPQIYRLWILTGKRKALVAPPLLGVLAFVGTTMLLMLMITYHVPCSMRDCTWRSFQWHHNGTDPGW